MFTTIPTGVADTAAAHYAPQKITVVWSTRRVECEPGSVGHAYKEIRADEPPELFDQSGRGDWMAIDYVQCGSDGTMVSVPTSIHHAHLRGAALKAVAKRVAASADEHFAWQADQMRSDLRQLIDGTPDIDEIPNLDTMAIPGVGRDGDDLVAWGYAPGSHDDMIEVRVPISETKGVTHGAR